MQPRRILFHTYFVSKSIYVIWWILKPFTFVVTSSALSIAAHLRSSRVARQLRPFRDLSYKAAVLLHGFYFVGASASNISDLSLLCLSGGAHLSSLIPHPICNIAWPQIGRSNPLV